MIAVIEISYILSHDWAKHIPNIGKPPFILYVQPEIPTVKNKQQFLNISGHDMQSKDGNKVSLCEHFIENALNNLTIQNVSTGDFIFDEKKQMLSLRPDLNHDILNEMNVYFTKHDVSPKQAEFEYAKL